MRNHLQGIALLVLLVAALWGMTRLASPALDQAFTDDGSAVTESGDVVDLVVDETLDTPLDDEERARLQFHLVLEGFLDDVSQVDGIIGNRTRVAIAEAAAAWGLDEPSDREFLTFADARSDDTSLFGGS